VLSPDPGTWEGGYIAANGSALVVNGEFFYWYQAGPKDAPVIALARSSDGRTWRKGVVAVVAHGPRGSWDERATADPDVLQLGDGRFYMYYLGQDRARRQRIGVARSRDGVVWEKLRANPVLEPGEPGAFDEEGLGEPAVWAYGGFYWMLYTGRNRAEERSMGLARSRDGANWERTPLVISGQAAWDSKVVCDPAVEAKADGVRVWFGGGDVASPDENLHGAIGVATLKPVE
jgi:sucrose-6-phosphate hydrolase SacC (GH32 family)